MLCRRSLLALVAGLAVGWSVLPRSGAADEQSDRIAALVKQLGANKFADRERAKRELQALGAPALEALKKAAADDNGEMGRRAGVLVAELEQRLLTDRVLGAKKVRLSFKDTPVIDAVDELVRQSGYNIQIQGPVEGLVKRKVTLETGATTFWQAFDQLCDKARLVEVPSQAAPAANLFPPNPMPGLLQIQPFPLRPMPRFQPNPRRPVPGLPGVLKVDKPGDNGAGQLLPGGMLFPAQFLQPGGGPQDEQLKQVQKMFEQQMLEMLRQLERQMQQFPQGQPGLPGLPGMPQNPRRFQQQQQQLMQQFLRQMQQLQQLQGQFPPLQGFPQMGARFRPGMQPAPEPEIRQLNVTDGTPRKVPTVYVGALRIRFLPGADRRDGEAALVLDVAVEPKVYGFSVNDGWSVERVVDDQGQVLTATPDRRIQVGGGPRGVASAAQPALFIRLGEKEAKALKELRGRLVGIALVPSDPLIVVNDIFNAVGKTSKGAGGGSIEILGVEKKGDGEVQVQLRLESPPFRGDGARASNVPALQDAKGESYQLVQIPSRGRRTNGRVVTQELTLLYRANPGQGDPTRLVLNGVRSTQVQVPFHVENVPLP